MGLIRIPAEQTEKTKADLQNISLIHDSINELEKKIRHLKWDITQIKQQCSHENHILDDVETMSFDITPVKVCVVCGLTSKDMTEDERRAFWVEYYESIDIPFPKDYDRIKFGINI